MSIKYFCYDCGKLLKLKGFDAVNEVGRKYCEGCGNNENNLMCINAGTVDKRIKKWNNKAAKEAE